MKPNTHIPFAYR